MPAKYAIHTKPAVNRQRPVGKLGIVDWREDCSSCHNCVKRSCIYGLYRDEADTLRDEIGYLDYVYQCKGCLSCVQNCTKNILTRVVNPEFARLGDGYYTPEIVMTTWYQSESGRIPVSGSGYGGPFSGEGFDSMWTDMSEIVRPTRDGIHGREYISTSVDVGRKLSHLVFRDGRLAQRPPPLMELPLPVIFDLIPEPWQRGAVVRAIAEAAAKLGTLAVLRPEHLAALPALPPDHVIPLLDGPACVGRIGNPSGKDANLQNGLPIRPTGSEARLAAAPMVMLPDGDEVMAGQAAIKAENPGQVVAIRMAASPGSARRCVELVRQGAEVIHLVFDAHGREAADVDPRHARDVIREVHRALVKDGTRDQATLSVSGGVALAEHMAKVIICGADFVAIDVPLLLALECRLCGDCRQGLPCQIALEEADVTYAVHRLVNLVGAWHQQLIEVLGAMGIREVRRLRGETGRAMFFEDLEREAFGKIFGKRKGKTA
jgi:Pyruvate/2-oxoacid:ferredoxin oxidoreductase delta subunit